MDVIKTSFMEIPIPKSFMLRTVTNEVSAGIKIPSLVAYVEMNKFVKIKKVR